MPQGTTLYALGAVLAVVIGAAAAQFAFEANVLDWIATLFATPSS